MALVWWIHRRKIVEQRQLFQSAEKYRKLAEQGDARREFDLGRMYFDGKGVTKDHAEALQW